MKKSLITFGGSTKDEIKIIELIHIASNVLSGGFLGVICIGIYILMHKDISHEVRSISYDIINFNLSFIIYTIIGFLSLFILIGFVLLPLIYCVWFILMVLGAIKHFAGERYTYPFVIKFLQ